MNDELLKHALAVTGTVLYVARAAPATIQIARRREVDPEAATTFGLLLLTGLCGASAESVAASRSCWWPGSPSRFWKS